MPILKHFTPCKGGTKGYTMRILSALFIVFLFLAAPALAATAPKSPELLPALLQEAIDAKNSNAGMHHLDLDKISASIFEETLPQINQSVQKGELILSPPLAAALGSLNSGNAATKRMAMLFLTAEVRKLLIYGVDSGLFAGDPLSENERMLMDGGVFSKFGDVSMGRKELSPGVLLQKDEKSALVETKLYDHEFKQNYLLRLRMELQYNIWTVTAIDNAVDICQVLLGML